MVDPELDNGSRETTKLWLQRRGSWTWGGEVRSQRRDEVRRRLKGRM
jgi:hypothetical protein